MPRIAEVKSAVSLFAGNRTGNDERASGLIAKRGALPVAVSKQEIGKIFTVAGPSALKVAGSDCVGDGGSPSSAKGNQAAASVGLQVIVVTLFELHTPNESVVPPDHGHLGRNIELRVVVGDRALSLTATDQGVVLAEAGGQRSALDVGDESVVGSWPALLRHVEAVVDGTAEVNETADAGAKVEDGIRTNRIVVAKGYALTLGVFSATIFAEAGAEGILRQAQQLPVGKPAENSLLAVNGLVDARRVSVRIAARAGVLEEVKNRHAWASRRSGNQLVQEISGGRIDEIGRTRGVRLAV